MNNTIEPLMASLWFERIAKIAKGQMVSVENALRHAFHLLELSPASLKHVFTLELDEESFEALLEAGAFEAAARCLAGDPTTLTLESDGKEARYRATIDCPIRGWAISGHGENEASAILNAWAARISGLESKYKHD